MVLYYLWYNITIYCHYADDWRCDQHRWISAGVHSLPKAAPQIRKMYFQIDTTDGRSKGFQRHGYQILGDKTTTVIHYIGAEGLSYRGLLMKPGCTIVHFPLT